MRGGLPAAWIIATVLQAAWCQQADSVLRNAYQLKTADGTVIIEFISSSSFRFARQWERGEAERRPLSEEKISFTVEERQDSVEFSTRYLRIELEKAQPRLRVRDQSGRLLLADVNPAARTPRGILWERQQFEGERFRGLGATACLEGFDHPEREVNTEVPFLISSLGYGEYFRARGAYRYQFGNVRRVLAPAAPESEYFFYYGPTPKEILEEHAAVERPLRRVDWAMFRLQHGRPPWSYPLPEPSPDWAGLRSLVRCVQEASYSALLLPAVDLAVWEGAPEEVAGRAKALAVVLPVIYSGKTKGSATEGLVRQRERWVAHLVSYGYEAQERGFPLVRPLGMQYPKDDQADRHRDEFMLGDELLVVPITDPGKVRRVYLPAGQWTDWDTNRRYPGRRVIEVEVPAEGILLFAKNGSLVPVVEAAGLVAAHYFPRLAGEFFFYEEGDGALTQLHAAPAGEWIRLEVEPARERTWEWVVHHVERPRKVWSGSKNYGEVGSRAQLAPGRWWFDRSRKNLHVQVRAPAGVSHVVYVSF